jgi:hypothetical protein
LPGNDAALAQDVHAVAEGLVRDAVVAGKVSLGGSRWGSSPAWMRLWIALAIWR